MLLLYPQLNFSVAARLPHDDLQESTTLRGEKKMKKMMIMMKPLREGWQCVGLRRTCCVQTRITCESFVLLKAD